jgi:hypothetical protein
MFVERAKVSRNVKLFVNAQLLVSEDYRQVSASLESPQAFHEHTTPLSATRRALPKYHQSVFQKLCGKDRQLIFLGGGKLPQINSCDFSSNGRCKVLNLLRGTEQRFLLGISKVTTVGDVKFLEGFPTDDGKVWLQRIFVSVSRSDMI